MTVGDIHGNPMVITECWMFVSAGDDGDEGVLAAPLEGNALTMPLIAVDQRRVDSLRPIAQQMAKVFDIEVKLIKFEGMREVERYQP